MPLEVDFAKVHISPMYLERLVGSMLTLKLPKRAKSRSVPFLTLTMPMMTGDEFARRILAVPPRYAHYFIHEIQQSREQRKSIPLRYPRIAQFGNINDLEN